jgi:hypothetical protein
MLAAPSCPWWADPQGAPCGRRSAIFFWWITSTARPAVKRAAAAIEIPLASRPSPRRRPTPGADPLRSEAHSPARWSGRRRPGREHRCVGGDGGEHHPRAGLELDLHWCLWYSGGGYSHCPTRGTSATWFRRRGRGFIPRSESRGKRRETPGPDKSGIGNPGDPHGQAEITQQSGEEGRAGDVGPTRQ